MKRAVPVMACGSIEEYNILPDEWEWSAVDRARIIRVLAAQGLTCTDQDAYVMWSDHSLDMCAGRVVLKADRCGLVR